jgi:3-oxoacyl-(acyl-carrier-protein) synthase
MARAGRGDARGGTTAGRNRAGANRLHQRARHRDPVNDGVEAKAYAAFLGDALPAARISSTKAAIGHTLGAAGAIEALFAIEALRTGDFRRSSICSTPIPEIAPALVARRNNAPTCGTS